jgi:hypothetical protein
MPPCCAAPAVLVGDDVRVGVADSSSAGGTTRRRQIWLPIVPLGRRRGLVAEQVGDLLLEGVDGRVLAVDVVADVGRGHDGPHRLGRPGQGVAAHVHGGHPT